MLRPIICVYICSSLLCCCFILHALAFHNRERILELLCEEVEVQKLGGQEWGGGPGSLPPSNFTASAHLSRQRKSERVKLSLNHKITTHYLPKSGGGPANLTQALASNIFLSI